MDRGEQAKVESPAPPMDDTRRKSEASQGHSRRYKDRLNCEPVLPEATRVGALPAHCDARGRDLLCPLHVEGLNRSRGGRRASA
jgi:hypothetical protein